jgi:hypothetical protein
MRWSCVAIDRLRGLEVVRSMERGFAGVTPWPLMRRRAFTPGEGLKGGCEVTGSLRRARATGRRNQESLAPLGGGSQTG